MAVSEGFFGPTNLHDEGAGDSFEIAEPGGDGDVAIFRMDGVESFNVKVEGGVVELQLEIALLSGRGGHFIPHLGTCLEEMSGDEGFGAGIEEAGGFGMGRTFLAASRDNSGMRAP